MTDTAPRGRTWAALLAAGVFVEFAALHRKRNEDTLSHCTRLVFRTHTRAGRRAFVFGWAALSAWFVPHILKEPLR